MSETTKVNGYQPIPEDCDILSPTAPKDGPKNGYVLMTKQQMVTMFETLNFTEFKMRIRLSENKMQLMVWAKK